MCSVKGMMKMASNTRRRTNNKRKIRSDIDKENEDPDISSFLPRKNPKMVRIQSQTSTSFTLGVKDGNVGSSLDGRLVFDGGKAKSGEVQEQHKKTGHAERNPRGSGGEGMSSGAGLKQDGELTPPDKNHEKISPRRVDHYFHKVYKMRSLWKPPKKSSTVAHQREKKKRETLEKLGSISAVLQEMGKAVCLVNVVNVCQGKVVHQGTGFVWVDRLIMISKHLVDEYLDGYKIKDDFIIRVLFNFDKPDSECITFTAERFLTDIFYDRDTAILQLKPEGYKPNQQRAENFKLPPGLLRYLARKPKNGIAHVIGHDAGKPKRYEQIRIIEPENIEQVINYHLAQFKDSTSMLQSIQQDLESQQIHRVMEGGDMAIYIYVYLCFMKDGSSGGPLCTGGGCFGVHTGEIKYYVHCDSNGIKKISVMAYAYDLHYIAERFVSNLRERGDVQMLERLELLALENLYLKQILKGEPMEVDQ